MFYLEWEPAWVPFVMLFLGFLLARFIHSGGTGIRAGRLICLTAAPGRYDARPIGYPLASGKGPTYQRMRLKALKLIEWGECWVLVIEMDDKSDRN